jgi:hypothetical protein
MTRTLLTMAALLGFSPLTWGQSVPLPAPNVVAFGAPGKAVVQGGYDGLGFAYDSALLPSGGVVTVGTVSFTLGAANVAAAASSVTITLPAVSATSIALLGSAVNGNQTAQKMIITYSDGTSTVATQSFSDWYTPQQYSGEANALTLASRVNSTGGLQTQTGGYHIYEYSIATNAAKTLKSLTLPKNRNVVILALDAIPAAAAPSVSLTWSAVTISTTGIALPTPVTYNVYRAATPVHATVMTKLASGIATPAYTDLAVTVGATYYYAVTATCPGCVESAQSAVVAGTVEQPPTPNQPLAPAGLTFH